MTIEQQKEVIVDQAVTLRIGLGQRFTAEAHGDSPRPPLVPLLVGHWLAVRTEPSQVLDRRAADLPSLEEAGAAKTGMGVAHGDQVAGELEERALALVQVPVDPTDLIVLGVDVVIPLLGTADLVAVRQHWHPL